MKKPVILKFILFALLLFQGVIIYSQNLKEFKKRYDNTNIRGDILLIGNNILNRDDRWKPWPPDPRYWSRGITGDQPNIPYFGKQTNSEFYMDNVDIDKDPNTFNSSSATLTLPDKNCSKIVYAGLYWGAVENSYSEPIDKVKFKTPGGVYNDINGTIIYNGINSLSAYACYADVTNYFTGLADPSGEYTVANVSTWVGFNGGVGLSAGWSLFVVYENATLPGKAITSFDGFSTIDKDNNLDIPIKGFTTIPVGPVKAKFAFSALEGDYSIGGDFLAINGVKATLPERPRQFFADPPGSTTLVEKDNFFNSSVTSMGTILNNRNPNGSNTLGFDAGIFEVQNNNNSVINNGDTSATIHLGSDQDLYYYYFNAFAVEIIAPRVILVEKIKGVDNNGNEYSANGMSIDKNKEVRYELTFQNKGNDDAENFTIKDVLPKNIVFDETRDILSLPTGVTLKSYDKLSRTILFNIDSTLVKKNGLAHTIKFSSKTTPDCDLLIGSCSDVVANTATSIYSGKINRDTFGAGTLSADEVCNVGIPTPINFSINRNNCTYEETLFLCNTGGTINLKARAGYTNYQWKDSNGTVFGGNHQEVAVTKTGTYTVTTALQCLGITQTFYVKDYSDASVKDYNPVNKYADNIDKSTGLPYTCTSNGRPFPKIFLSGKDAKKLIDTGITDATSIIWQEKTNAQITGLNDSCPDESAVANWTTIASATNQPTYTVDKAGAFRLTVTNGTGPTKCTNIYYFNVTKNPLEPTFTQQDVVCKTKGIITITNPIPTDGYGYEYSLEGVKTMPYQNSNVFNNLEEGTYQVYIKSKVLYDGFEKYEFIIKNVKIEVEPVILTKIILTKPLTACNPAEITVASVSGGSAPYSYYVNSSSTPQSSPEIFAPTAGRYTIKIEDSNKCQTTATINVVANPKPSAIIAQKNIKCSGDNNGEIAITLSPAASDYTASYSIDNGVTFVSNPVFSNLVPATYNVVVKYTYNNYANIECSDPPKPVKITSPDALSLSLTPNSILPEYCSGDKNGAFSVDIAGGTPPYKTALDNQSGDYVLVPEENHTSGGTAPNNGGSNSKKATTYKSAVSATNYTFSNLVGGVHTVYLTDANNCSTQLRIVTPNSVNLKPVTTINTDCVNNSVANFVIITVDKNANPADLDYALDNSTGFQQSNVFVNIPPNTHTVTARHTNGCEQKTLPFTIDAVQPLTISFADTGLNQIAVIAKGGEGNYQYTLDGKSYEPGDNLIIYKSETHTASVADSNGCTAAITKYFEFTDVSVPNQFTPNGDGINDTWAPGYTVHYKDLTFDILDRYGRVLGKYKLGQSWDGKYNGVELPSGDYWYILKLNDINNNKEFVGHFTLYR